MENVRCQARQGAQWPKVIIPPLPCSAPANITSRVCNIFLLGAAIHFPYMLKMFHLKSRLHYIMYRFTCVWMTNYPSRSFPKLPLAKRCVLKSSCLRLLRGCRLEFTDGISTAMANLHLYIDIVCIYVVHSCRVQLCVRASMRPNTISTRATFRHYDRHRRNE